MRKNTIKVTLREKKMANGKLSLYLDFYPPIFIPGTKKTTRREFLGIYIFKEPRTYEEKRSNIDMRHKAEHIRLIREEAANNSDFKFLKSRKTRISFLNYFKKKALKKNDKWMATYRHFEIFTHGSCSVEDINLELCNNFKNYLLAAHQIGRTKHSLSQNSAASYFSIFSSLLKIAFFEKLLDEDPNLILEKI